MKVKIDPMVKDSLQSMQAAKEAQIKHLLSKSPQKAHFERGDVFFTYKDQDDSKLTHMIIEMGQQICGNVYSNMVHTGIVVKGTNATDKMGARVVEMSGEGIELCFQDQSLGGHKVIIFRPKNDDFAEIIADIAANLKGELSEEAMQNSMSTEENSSESSSLLRSEDEKQKGHIEYDTYGASISAFGSEARPLAQEIRENFLLKMEFGQELFCSQLVAMVLFAANNMLDKEKLEEIDFVINPSALFKFLAESDLFDMEYVDVPKMDKPDPRVEEYCEKMLGLEHCMQQIINNLKETTGNDLNKINNKIAGDLSDVTNINKTLKKMKDASIAFNLGTEEKNTIDSICVQYGDFSRQVQAVYDFIDVEENRPFKFFQESIDTKILKHNTAEIIAASVPPDDKYLIGKMAQMLKGQISTGNLKSETTVNNLFNQLNSCLRKRGLTHDVNTELTKLNDMKRTTEMHSNNSNDATNPSKLHDRFKKELTNVRESVNLENKSTGKHSLR